MAAATALLKRQYHDAAGAQPDVSSVAPSTAPLKLLRHLWLATAPHIASVAAPTASLKPGGDGRNEVVDCVSSVESPRPR